MSAARSSFRRSRGKGTGSSARVGPSGNPSRGSACSLATRKAATFTSRMRRWASGDTDIVVVNGWIMPMRAMFQHPETRAVDGSAVDDRQSHQFDKRGTGLSDRVKELPSHEQRMDDLRVVLDACGSEEGRPSRVFRRRRARHVVRGHVSRARSRLGALRCLRAHDASTGLPSGYAPEDMEKLKGYIRGAWGKGASLRAIAPSELSDPDFVDWVTFAEQEGRSPGSALDLLEMNIRIDLRALLPTIRVPTVVSASCRGQDDSSGQRSLSRGAHPQCPLRRGPGDDHIFFFRNQHEIVDAVRWVSLSRTRPTAKRTGS